MAWALETHQLGISRPKKKKLDACEILVVKMGKYNNLKMSHDSEVYYNA